MVAARWIESPPPSAIDFASAFLANTVKRANAAGLELSPEEVQVLATWICLEVADETAGEDH